MDPPSSFDDDLSDLLDAEPPAPTRPFTLDIPTTTNSIFGTATSETSAPEPVAEIVTPVLPEEPQPVEPLTAVFGSFAPSPEAEPPATAIEIPAAAESEPQVEAGSETPSPPPTPPYASPWESMRKKKGFWPPQGATASPPAASAVASSDAGTPASTAANATFLPGSGPFPAWEAQQAHNFTAPSTTADLIARLHAGLTEQERAPDPSPTPLQFDTPLGAAAPRAAEPPAPNGVGYAPASPAAYNNAAYNNYAQPYPAASQPEPAPVVGPPPPDPYARPLSTDAMMNAALAQLMSGGTPAQLMSGGAPAQPIDPFARSQPPRDMGDRYGSAPMQSYPPYQPDPAVAAAAAFEALTQGLAGSPRSEPPRQYYDYNPAVGSRPPNTALVAQPLVPAVQDDYHPVVVRTLEDAVADMLKPMLQKWLADNMPRIIERALRVEAASGSKLPGSS